MAASEDLGSKCPACGDAATNCSSTAERSVSAWEASPVTLLVSGSSEDGATFEVWDSSEGTAEERAPYTADCSHVAVWQVFVSNWVNKWELVVELQLALLPSDFRSSAAFRDPSDEASAPDCDLAGADGSFDSFAVLPLPTDVGPRSTCGASPPRHVGFVAPSEIVAGIVTAVELRVMIQVRVVGPPDSSRDVGAGAIAVAAGDSVVSESGEIVGSAGCQ